MIQTLLVLILLVAVNFFLEKVLANFNIAKVLSPLFIGLIVGPMCFNILEVNHFIEEISMIGVLILMFLAGLETNLKKMFKIFKPALILALVCVIIPIIFYTLICYFADLSLEVSIFIGILFAATSISVPIQLFKEKNKIDTDYGRLILGAAVFDDIIVMILLSITLSFITQDGSSTSMYGLIFSLVIIKVLFFGFIYTMHRYAIPNFVKSVKIDTLFKMLVLAFVICTVFSNIAHMSGISGIIGAFFGGLALSSFNFRDELNGGLEKIGNSFFIPVFFISIGLGLSNDGVSSRHYILLIAFLTLAFLTKYVGGFFASRKFGMDKRKSNIVGSAMVSRGEVALIICQIGLDEEIFKEQLYTITIFTIIFTTVISPLLLNFHLKKPSLS